MTDPASDQDSHIISQLADIRNEIDQEPGIGPLINVADALVAEFTGNDVFLKKIQSLTFKSVRRARRDGNCFYRSFLFALFQGMVGNVPFQERIRKDFRVFLEEGKKYGYESFIIEDMLEELEEQLSVMFPEGEKAGDLQDIEQLFANNDMMYPITFLRFITSCHLKEHREELEPFLECGDMDIFCQTEVDPAYREADQMQVQALATKMRVSVNIAYLDQSEGDSCTTHRMTSEGTELEINMLYRPGHYDLLY